MTSPVSASSGFDLRKIGTIQPILFENRIEFGSLDGDVLGYEFVLAYVYHGCVWVEETTITRYYSSIENEGS